MRITFPATIVLTALAFTGCNDDGNKPSEPSKTSNTSEAAPRDSSTTTTTDGVSRGPDAAHAVKADNTARNAENDSQTLTPLDQGNSEKDLAITQSVRKAVMAHKGLSVNAQNVKIIAKDGVVTLRGPVESESERSTIVTMAEQVPEVRVVVNKLEIAAR